MPTPTRPFLRALPALASLAALGLAAAHPQAACAQSLTLNGSDGVTVNGAGTFGVIGGIPVTNGTKSYDDSDGKGYAVQTNDASTFTLGTGGTLSAGLYNAGLYANGSGAITVSGGTINAGDNGTGLLAESSGPINISGGTLSGGSFGLVADGNVAVTVSGGTFTAGAGGYGLVDGGGAVNISGGTFTAGAGGYGLVDGGGAVNLYGSFAGLTPGQTEDLPSSGSGDTGSFFGTLENDSVGQTFTYDNFSTITLHNVGLAATPEPSGFVGLGIGLLGLGALALRARRRTT